jgi:probable HAF family extracellular repeat protein
VPDAVRSYGSAIQADGTAYGSAILSGGHAFVFMSRDGVVGDLAYDPDFTWTAPTSVNRTGQMSGWAANTSTGEDPPCPMDPVAYMNGSWISLGTLGGSCGQANGINDSGVVVGWSLPAVGNGHAFRWQNGSMSDLGTLGGNESVAEDINDQGQIVGIAEDSGFVLHAFIWIDGTMTDLATLVDSVPPDTTLSEALSINGKGQILVQGLSSGRLHAFLLDPLDH